MASGARAAARGGATTVVCMANTTPPIDTPELVRQNLARAADAPARVLQAACITKGMSGRELADLAALRDAGAVLFTDDGRPITDSSVALAAMEEARRLGVPLSFHEEDPALIGSAGVNAGAVSEMLGLAGAHAASEEVLVARDCALAIRTRARVCIQHVSSALSLEIIKDARARGADVWAEVTPHHFSLTQDDVPRLGTHAKMNPPLRTHDDRRAIVEALRSDPKMMIATDHAPHSPDEKSRAFENAPSGVIGLETSLAAGVTHLVRGAGISISRLVELMSCAPARFLGISGGRIAVGDVADIVIFAPDEERVIGGEFASKSRNCPFIGERMFGVVKYTILGGEISYDIKRDDVR